MAAIDRKIPTGVISRGDCGFIRFYASHSALWASHHAGKLGSFGERVGLIALISVTSDPSSCNENGVKLMFTIPKSYSFRSIAGFVVHFVPE